MSNGDGRIEVRGMRDPPLRFGTWLTGADAAEGVPDDQTLRWISESGRENFEVFDFGLGRPESDAIDLLAADVRSGNLLWEPDWNA